MILHWRSSEPVKEVMQMAREVEIRTGQIEATAELNDSGTARAIWEALPIKGRVNRWGEEVYFSIPVRLELEAGQEVVEMGDLGYWPAGSAFCIFFGRTPASRGDEIRPASPVTVFGRVSGDAAVFQQAASGTEITVEQAGQG